jgi:hypothetical protein
VCWSRLPDETPEQFERRVIDEAGWLALRRQRRINLIPLVG